MLIQVYLHWRCTTNLLLIAKHFVNFCRLHYYGYNFHIRLTFWTNQWINTISPELTREQKSAVYASAADLLNMALFGITAARWRRANPEKMGNIRDYANVSPLGCLGNPENLNAHFIGGGCPGSQAGAVERCRYPADEDFDRGAGGEAVGGVRVLLGNKAFILAILLPKG